MFATDLAQTPTNTNQTTHIRQRPTKPDCSLSRTIIMSFPPQSNVPSESPLSDGSLAVCVRDLCDVLQRVHLVANRLNCVICASADPSARVIIPPRPTVPVDEIAPDSVAPDSDNGMSDSEASFVATGYPDSNPEKWYCVTVGRVPGVFHGLSEVTPNINRIPGGQATKWKTRAEAEEAFFHALDRGMVEKVVVETRRTTLDRSDRSQYSLAA
ncbi:hypothetical protein D9613_012091 [Agrocybe pediades]|uniref:Ribonuclease H1 N-terminal domain-containing protein n=1 Tax=Agrocybe pediades TaxID=84607 RepID=A0A8H4R2X7_9AGAR|nr:hypothetical protein D9613_012091 [Agrocybe pediades]